MLLGLANAKLRNDASKLQCEDDHYCSDQCHDTHHKNYHNFVCKSTHKDNADLMALYKEFDMVKEYVHSIRYLFKPYHFDAGFGARNFQLWRWN